MDLNLIFLFCQLNNETSKNDILAQIDLDKQYSWRHQYTLTQLCGKAINCLLSVYCVLV